jgi:crossover junction endodeoxyribonuclease RuvC
VFERVILGVDPGTSRCGMAIVSGNGNRAAVEWSATVRTSPALGTAERLARIAGAVREAVGSYSPEAVALERLLWGRNTGSAMEVARASGAVMLTAADAGLAVEEYAPGEVKMAVTGSGTASKEQVRRGISMILGTPDVPLEPDAADAVAVALCHLQVSRLRRAVEGRIR